MPRKKIYEEVKKKITLTLTPTAITWLENKREEMSATSLSDAIERIAREKLDKR